MSIQLTLVDEQDDTLGFKRLKFTPSGSSIVRSDAPSLVRAITTVPALSSSVQCTRQAIGTPVYGDQELAWISEPFDGSVSIAAENWTVSLWGYEKTAGDHYTFNVQVKRYHNGAEDVTFLNLTGAAELGTSTGPIVLTGLATAQTMSAGDRIVVRVFVVPIGGSAAADEAVFSYNGLLAGADGDTFLICPDNLVSQLVLPPNDSVAVLQILHDETNSIITPTEVTKALQDAVKKYSKDRQVLTSQYYSGDSSSFIFPLPRNWIWGASDLIEVEYPSYYPENDPLTAGISQTRSLDTVNTPDDWEIVESAVNNQPTRSFWSRTFIPDAGVNNLCLRYTTRQRHDILVDTIPQDDYMAFIWLAASYAANTLASRFASVNDPSIMADAVDYRGRFGYWSAQAAEFMALYDDHIRGEDPPAEAASRNDNWNTDLSFYHLDRLTHPRRWR